MYSKDDTILLLMLETIEKIFQYTSDLKNAEELKKDLKNIAKQ